MINVRDRLAHTGDDPVSVIEDIIDDLNFAKDQYSKMYNEIYNENFVKGVLQGLSIALEFVKINLS